ncbi:protein FdrA [Thermaerobacter marianensis DSM 12885]|uniref:Protein FdrA n=1 Tax=Thermaerobacter marianensis (strain ATCC 700841 / DSM 12885 / JCM 10246 / 7p75a) TaxID=644966 RepID=E6SGD5_THEM7|nr:protein FdrA [Thermaerobacter marianensis]ADU51587.1 protein FdrA [Thermaerobacter marianensis DSM 12885]
MTTPDAAGVIRTLVRPGAYYDSITLMQLQRHLRQLPGVDEAGAVMATDANKELLAMAGLLGAEAAAAGPGDLVVAVRGPDPRQLDQALAQAEGLLQRRSGPLVPQSGAGYGAGSGPGGGPAARQRTLSQAVAALPGANLALISVPGRFARWVAEEALDLGLHVFCFSDNVPLADEAALKTRAASRGLLFMGPDCGTAVVAGTGLGFANAVRPGPVSIVAASGTGLQEVACQLDRLGTGVRHAIGTGGRDLHDEVGGATFLAAIAALARDPGTRVIVALSKPPAPAVRQRVAKALAASGKPFVFHTLGDEHQPCPTLAATARAAALLARQVTPEAQAGGGGKPAPGAADREAVPPAGGPTGAPEGDLEPHPASRRQREVQLQAEGLLARARQLAAALGSGQTWVRGLYGGGTLCYEGQLLVHHLAGPVASNAPLPGMAAYRAGDPLPPAHLLLDLGADEFTAGRLHPMLDAETRLRYLATAARDPKVAVVLMDVALGYGAHPDPAAELAPAIVAARAAAAAEGRHLVVVAALCGTEADPQGLDRQARRLEAAGAVVLPSHAEAALLAGAVAALAAGRPVEPAALSRWLLPRPVEDRDGDGGGGGTVTGAVSDDRPATGPGDPIDRLLAGGVVAVNVGVPMFAESLTAQGVPVVHVDWRPPAGGNPRVLEALRRLRG